MNRAKYYYDNKKETNYGMFLAYLTLITALTISGVAIFYSVSGLAAIFSAAVIPIIIMGGVLEVSKLVTAVWLHRYWRIATWWLKAYLSIAVLVLMLITSIGIFGFLSKAHDTASGNATEAIATVQRIDGQIAREENRIVILQERIDAISSGSGIDVSSSIEQLERRIAGASEEVAGDIAYAEGQITRLNNQIDALDKAVNDLRIKGVEVIETDAGGTFRRAETETIDYVAQADALYEQQTRQRAGIDEDIDALKEEVRSYRQRSDNTKAEASAEIRRLRERSSSSQDDDFAQSDEWGTQIDNIYLEIDTLKDEKFESEQAVRLVESEVGPIRYIAEFFTQTEDADASLLETAVSWLIMVIIFVFDPLAVLLLIASQYTFEHRNKIGKGDPDGSTDSESDGDDLRSIPDSATESGPIDIYSDNTQTSGTRGSDKDDILPLQPTGTASEFYDKDHRSNSIDRFEDVGFALDMSALEPSIEEARAAIQHWEDQQKLLVDAEEEVSVENDQVVEPVPEPIIEEVAVEKDIQVADDEAPRVSQGFTYTKLEDSEYLLDPQGKSIHLNALQSAHPEFFLKDDTTGRLASTSFGTSFPFIAIKGDIFVRVDQMPNRIYKFEGKHWIEIDKATTDSYTFDEEYIKYIIAQIKSGEYDIDLLSESERHQVEIYLTQNTD
jgi:hypothetical protein